MAKLPIREVTPTPLLSELKDSKIEFDLGTTLGAIWNDVYETTGIINELKLYSERDKVNDKSASRSRIEAIYADAERQRKITELAAQLDFVYNENEKEEIRQQIEDLRQQKAQLEVWREEQVQAGRLESAESLNEQYKDIGLTFDRDMTKAEADQRAKIKKEQIARNAVIQAGPKGSGAFVAQTGTALLRSVIDPLAFASAFIPIVGTARSARLVSKFGKVKGRAVEGAIEGTGGAILIEPLMLGLSESQQLDYTYSDSLLNIGAGFLLGTGIGSIAGKLSRTVEMREEQVKVDLDVDKDAFGDGVESPTVTVRNQYGPSQLVKSDRKLAVKMKKMAEIAISLAAAGKRIDLSFLGPALPERPQTLTEFVRSLGGVQDAPYARQVATTLRIKPNVKGVSILSADSKYTMEVMAELAYEQGFIQTKSVRALAGALRKEAGGNYQFRRKDQAKVKNYLNSSGAETFDQAIDLEIDLIKLDADNLGVKISDEQAYAIAEMRSKGLDIDDAYRQLGIDIEPYRAKAAAKYANDPANDADSIDEAEFDTTEVPEDEAMIARDDTQELEEYFNNLTDEDINDMLPEARAEIEEMRKNDEHSEYHKTAIKQAHRCVLGQG